MPIATTCPHCRAVYNLADHLRGRIIRCKKCHGATVVGQGPAREPEEKSRVAASTTGTGGRGKGQAESGLARRSPRRQQEKSQRQRKRIGNGPVVIVLTLAGMALFLLGIGAFASLMLRARSGNRVADTQVDARASQAEPSVKRSPDMLVDISGPWPEPINFPPVMGNVDRNAFVIIRIANALDDNTRAEVGERLGYLADSGFPATTGASKDNRLAIRISPVKDPQAFADKIDFATVRLVSGRTITIVAHKSEGPMSDPDEVTKALARLKLPYSAAHKKAAILLKGKKLDERRAELLHTPDRRQAEVLRGLEAALNEPDRYTREEIYQALGVWGTNETVPVLLKDLPKEETRATVIQALGRIKDPSAAEQIAPHLVPISTRWSAAEALKAMGPAAEPFVIMYLDQPDVQVRLMVCSVLGKIGGPRSIAELEKLTQDKDTAISITAKGTIEEIHKRR
jgi:hypothetical protein